MPKAGPRGLHVQGDRARRSSGRWHLQSQTAFRLIDLSFREAKTARRPAAGFGVGEWKRDVSFERAIELKGVCKDFPSADGGVFRALDSIELNVASGEFVALVGPSGCGKTSILRLIAALETPTAGVVSVNGEPPQRLAERHRLAIAFQEHALLPWLTVKANLELPFHIAGRTVDQRQDRRSAGAGPAERIRPSEAEAAFRRHAPEGRDRAGADP